MPTIKDEFLQCVNLQITNNILSKKGTYKARELYVLLHIDENDNQLIEFKDKLGRVILTRQFDKNEKHDTYYVYDDIGNLRYVLPPIASDRATNYTETDPVIQQYAYIYKYDSFNRCIWKKLPGIDPVYYIYDKADRLIFSQDGEQRTKNEWRFSIPDNWGRTVLTGTCRNTLNYAADPLKTVLVYGTLPDAVNGVYKGYNVTGITLTSAVVHSVNYYDNYKFVNYNGVINASYTDETGFNTRYTISNKGLLTGTLTAQYKHDGTISADYLYSVFYYDDKGRVIQQKSSNHIGGTESVYLAYNYIGSPIKKKHVHTDKAKLAQTEIYTYNYDHAGRLKTIKHKLNSEAEVTLVANSYDKLGRLDTIRKHTNARLMASYKYNTRSWIKSISSPLFSETLYYNDTYGGGKAQYNGNISAMSWSVDGESGLRGYAFSYDNLSRLTASNYLVNGSANNNYSVQSITYDKHGNMRTMGVYGKNSPSTYGRIGYLIMGYTGNQLVNVDDDINLISIAESEDFNNYTYQSVEYTYNKNGAMTKDLNKGIHQVLYNSLNLPMIVDLKSPLGEARNEYLYSASGVKLGVSQRYNSNYNKTPVVGSAVTTSLLDITKKTDYVGNKIYVNGVLKQLLVDGGYYDVSTRKYHFYMTNHLGTNRVVANQDGVVVQKTHYYPFGLSFADGTGQGAQPYKYTGKEYDKMHGLNLYDYSARQYDPALGRFTSIDPLAEKYYSWSPYHYAANNPLKYVDYRGDSISLAVFQQFDKENGGNFIKTIIVDLQAQTGLTYSVDANGKLTYNTDEDGNPAVNSTTDSHGNVVVQGSATARGVMIEAISHADKVNVMFGARSGVPTGTNIVGLSPKQINQFITGSSGVDSRTLGWGMTLMHELHHTQVGGGLSDSPHSQGNPGPVATQMNIIRSELNAKGGNYGQRIDYPSTSVGFSGSVLPFSNAASSTLRSTGIIPIGLPYILIQ